MRLARTLAILALSSSTAALANHSEPEPGFSKFPDLLVGDLVKSKPAALPAAKTIRLSGNRVSSADHQQQIDQILRQADLPHENFRAYLMQAQMVDLLLSNNQSKLLASSHTSTS